MPKFNVVYYETWSRQATVEALDEEWARQAVKEYPDSLSLPVLVTNMKPEIVVKEMKEEDTDA